MLVTWWCGSKFFQIETYVGTDFFKFRLSYAVMQHYPCSINMQQTLILATTDDSLATMTPCIHKATLLYINLKPFFGYVKFIAVFAVDVGSLCMEAFFSFRHSDYWIL